MADTHYIAVDLGAESGRVMLGTVGSAGIKLQEMHRFPNGPVRVGAAIHWDILRLWGEIQTGIAKVTAQHTVAGIGVDTWGVDFGLLGEDGALLGNPCHYRDSRTDGQPEKVFARLSREKIFGITGIQTMVINTLFHLAALSEANAPQLRVAKHLLFTPDLINYWLSGVMANEYTIASTSQMLDATKRDWSPEVLQAIGVRRDLFPRLVQPATRESILGGVQASTGDAIGATGIPVIAIGGHDTASAVAAVPATGNDWLYLSSGTWSLLGAEVDQPVLTPQAAEYNVTNEGGVGGKIRLLKNIAGLWLLQECKRHWAKEGHDYHYATLADLAADAKPHTAVIDTEDPAFNTPGDMPAKIAAQLRRSGQTVPETPGQFTRVILESLAIRYAAVVKMMEHLTGKRFTKLHIVGGGSQNGLLNQMAADATGLTVFAGPVEATALGNVMGQALATGQIASLAEGRALVGKSVDLKKYTPRDTEKWAKWVK